MGETRRGGTSTRVIRFALAAGLAALLLVCLGAARAAQERPARYLHGFNPAGSGEGEIWAMNTDGSSQVNLTNDHAADDEDPLGRRTARRSRTRTSARAAMRRSSRWTATARTSTISRTTRPTTTGTPEWSPDGSLVVWVTRRRRRPELRHLGHARRRDEPDAADDGSRARRRSGRGRPMERRSRSRA